MILRIYRFITLLTGPLIDLYLKKRQKAGKEDNERFNERLGYASFSRPNGLLIWIHAASVGETLSVLALIRVISEKYQEANLLLTTGTVSSAKMVESKLPVKAFHQYVPVDRITAVKRFLKHWKPNLALWVESELWPNLITETEKYCPIMLVNARMSDESYRKWQRYRNVAKQLLRCFKICLPQSLKDAERLENLGAVDVKYLGNLKFDAPPLPANPKKMGELVSAIGERQVWLAASTHKGEEKAIAKIHKKLKEEFPGLLTLIVPRHPQRSAEIKEEVKKLGLQISVRSQNDFIEENTDIYLADTMGELGIFYRLVPIVFIGGSLYGHGGQNPLEACRLECAIILGPTMQNFSEITEELEQNDAAIIVNNEIQLTKALDELLPDSERQEILAANAAKVVKNKSGVLNLYVDEVSQFIDAIAKNKQ